MKRRKLSEYPGGADVGPVKSTGIPWERSDSHESVRFSVTVRKGRHRLADVNGHTDHEACARAARIERAWNSHDVSIAAMETALKELSVAHETAVMFGHKKRYGSIAEATASLRAALRLAKEGLK